ncbi:hypothetical protein BH09BAC3_BH09BAC3_30090 [soil metagenome]
MNYFDKPRILVTIIIVLIVLNIATMSFMWLNRPPHEPGRGGARPANFLIEKVGFSPEQIETYHGLMEEHQRASTSINDSLRFYKSLTFSYLPQNNTAAVKESVSSVGRLQQQMEMNTFEHFVKVRALCTPEQAVKFDAVINEVLKMMVPGPQPKK